MSVVLAGCMTSVTGKYQGQGKLNSLGDPKDVSFEVKVLKHDYTRGNLYVAGTVRQLDPNEGGSYRMAAVMIAVYAYDSDKRTTLLTRGAASILGKQYSVLVAGAEATAWEVTLSIPMKPSSLYYEVSAIYDTDNYRSPRFSILGF
jgi:hypothetical protein